MALGYTFANDIQGTTGFEPFNLLLVVAVVHHDGVGTAIFVVQNQAQGFSRGKLGQAQNVDVVVLLDLVVISLVVEG
jgi:hypothetical protein